MPKVTASVVIAQPPQTVWDYIIRPDNLSIILPGIVSVDAGKEPPYAPGDVWHGVSRSFGITNRWTGVFTRVDMPEVMEMEITESKFPFATIDTLEEVPEGTRYTFRVVGEPAIRGPLGRLLDAVMSAAFKRALVKSLAQLPAQIDAAVREKH
ncbi:SRPBCC family protein [Mycobacterium paraffinicum]|nr:SRPBCC family protein [Mycobacterium paraffinicum]